MEAINIVSAENVEGRIDVARALGSTATLMFIYDLAPGQSSCPYHFEYEGKEWSWSSTAQSWCAHLTGSTLWSAEASFASRPFPPERTS